MSKNLLARKSGVPLQEPATECLSSSWRLAQPGSDSDLDLDLRDGTEKLPADADFDSDATMRVRQSATPARGIQALQRIAGYEVLEELGRGGMGVVYKAWQHSLQRNVAVKMILAGSFAGAEDLERFRAEAMAIARLHHPHLLNIFEIGESDHLPFYAMEYMEGGSLSRRLNGQPIAPHVATSLLRSLAQAMDYAHKNGIVHRDLKPANILLSGDVDTPLAECIAKVTDFGIAKQLHQNSNYTRTGDILGTPDYMAPEQAMGRTGEVGPAADVYSLGAILYELLTGRPPFQGPSGADVLMLLAKEEPERPTHWQRSIPRDLETICLKCLEKDSARRYASAGALADDLMRFLQNEPIQAKPASVLDRSVKWTRRRPTLAALLLVASCAAVLGVGIMALMMGQAVDHAKRQDDLLTESKALLADAFLERGMHLAEKGDVRRGMHWMLRSLEVTEEIEAKRKTPSELAQIIRMNLSSWGQCVSSREMSLPHGDWIWDVAFSPCGNFLASGSKDTRVQMWNRHTGEPVGAALAHPFPVWGVAFHPDGKTLFTVCGDSKHDLAGRLCAWSADPEKPGHFVPRGDPVTFPYSLSRLVLNAQGNRLWLGNISGMALLYAFDAEGAGNGLSLVNELPGHHQQGTFSPDGATLATIPGSPLEKHPYFLPGQLVQLWDGQTGQTLGAPLDHQGPVRTAIFSRDSKRLIVGNALKPKFDQGEMSLVQVWDLAQRRLIAHSGPLQGRVKASATAVNGQLFAISLFEFIRPNEKSGRIQINDGHILLWQLHANGAIEPHGTPLKANHVVWSMDFSPDSRMLLAGCENSGAFLWNVSNCQQLLNPVWHEGNCVKVAFSPDGRMAATASAGGWINYSGRLWEVPRFSHIGPPLPQPAGIRSAFWADDQKHVWVGCGKILCRWDPARGEKVEEIPLTEFAHFAHSAGKDDRFFVALDKDMIGEVNRHTGELKPLPEVSNPHFGGTRFDFHADRQIFLRLWENPCRFQLIDVNGKPASRLVEDPRYEMRARGLSPQADSIAISQTIMQQSNRLLIYETREMKRIHEIPVRHPINTICYTPDGKTIAFGGLDRQIQRYDLSTGKLVGSPLLHEGIIHWVSYLGNDRLLATCSEKGLILLWDAPTGKRIGPAFEHRTDLVSIAAHPQGKFLLTANHNKTAIAWRIPEPVQGSLAEIRLWLELMTGMEMNAHDIIVPIEMDRLQERRGRKIRCQ